MMSHKHKAHIYTGSAFAIALVFLNTTPAFSDPNAEQINAVVKSCVEGVETHALKKKLQASKMDGTLMRTTTQLPAGSIITWNTTN